MRIRENGPKLGTTMSYKEWAFETPILCPPAGEEGADILVTVI
jgi:hypothetical protein